jgi:hypothetical protein
MSFEVVGKLIKKYDTENKTGSFQAREFVIEVEGQYPQYVKFQLVQDRCALLDAYSEGDSIKVSFDLRGREWQGKYFTNLNAWRLEAAESTDAGATAGGGASQPLPPPITTPFPSAGDEPPRPDDDLPF